jgi:hypothetical protein
MMIALTIFIMQSILRGAQKLYVKCRTDLCSSNAQGLFSEVLGSNFGWDTGYSE